MNARPSLAVIVPMLDEARALPALMAGLDARVAPDDIVLVDGGSRDGSRAIARRYRRPRAGQGPRPALRLSRSGPGRAAQMNLGAACSRADILLFLHADTRLPAGAAGAVRRAVAGGCLWGRFDVCLDARGGWYRIIGTLMNARSAWTGIATGDQAIFVRRDVFEACGGYANIPLMEDIDLSRRLRALSRPACLSLSVRTSARRWKTGGVLRTVILMWWLRLRYWCGSDPARLALRYRAIR